MAVTAPLSSFEHVAVDMFRQVRPARPESAFVSPAACARVLKASASVDLHRCVREARARGYNLVAGADEAGAGALAGPLVCAAVAVGGGHDLEWLAGLKDSKRVTARRRATLYRALLADERVSVATAIVSAADVDRLNILQARRRGLAAAVDALPEAPDFLFVDGNFVLDGSGVAPQRQRAVIGGDAIVSVVAAASVVAKEVRDAIVAGELQERFPQYGFARHKGYPTQMHRRVLQEIGPCPEHRVSFRPVREAAAARGGVSFGR